MTAYYNENDPFAAQWLRSLIKAGHIAVGDVDDRSIRNVDPVDLKGYTQCHFFAGIGGWSHALRLAGWPDDEPVWTGSCPCQPFSAAGQQKGFQDERHLWPVWFNLICECSPTVVFGEQVAAAIKQHWLDAVFADLEGQGYACGATVLPACSVGAPHIRQRLWFVANSNKRRSRGCAGTIFSSEGETEWQVRSITDSTEFGSTVGELGDAADAGSQGRRERWDGTDQWPVGTSSLDGSMVDAPSEQVGLSRRPWQSGSTDWLPCTDGKARPVEPGTFPLAHGVPGRVGRLRAYGNAIVPQVAVEFIRAATHSGQPSDRPSPPPDVDKPSQ